MQTLQLAIGCVSLVRRNRDLPIPLPTLHPRHLRPTATRHVGFRTMHTSFRGRRESTANRNGKYLQSSTSGTPVPTGNHATQVTGDVRKGHDETDKQVSQADGEEQGTQIHQIPCVPTAQVNPEETP